MLDRNLIRDNPDFFIHRLASRGDASVAAGWVNGFVELDRKRRAAETEIQGLQAERNRKSKEIGAIKAKGGDIAAVSAEVRAIGDRIKELDATTEQARGDERALLLSIPNIPHEACPAGQSAEENPVVRIWGEKPVLDFPPLSHLALGAQHRLFDFERAAKVAGSAFTCFTGAGAKLQRTLINFLLNLHTTEHGYTEVSPPFVANTDSLIGTTQLPKFEEQQYRIDRDGLYLVPTAEVPVTNLHREELLTTKDLPIKYAAYTPCFRREAGAAGLGTRGLIRLHQFDKVELVKIVRPEVAFVELEALTADAEKVLQLLGLHYRVIELCTGDLGFGATKTYDIEVWAPGQGQYLEVSSCTNFGDYQARRMNLRFKDDEGKNVFCHTLNGSGTALPRLYVALLETYQQKDGSIRLPEPLQAGFGAAVIG